MCVVCVRRVGHMGRNECQRGTTYYGTMYYGTKRMPRRGGLDEAVATPPAVVPRRQKLYPCFPPLAQ